MNGQYCTTEGDRIIYREVAIVGRNSAESEVQRLLGKRSEHYDRLEKVSNGARQGAIMGYSTTGYDAGLQENGSTCMNQRSYVIHWFCYQSTHQ